MRRRIALTSSTRVIHAHHTRPDAIRAVIGEFADYVVASQRVEPVALLASGFTFEHPDLDGAVRWLVKR